MSKVLIPVFCLAVLNLFYFWLYEYFQKLVNSHSVTADLIIMANIVVSVVAITAAFLLRRKKKFMARLSVGLAWTALIWTIIYNSVECIGCKA